MYSLYGNSEPTWANRNYYVPLYCVYNSHSFIILFEGLFIDAGRSGAPTWDSWVTFWRRALVRTRWATITRSCFETFATLWSNQNNYEHIKWQWLPERTLPEYPILYHQQLLLSALAATSVTVTRNHLLWRPGETSIWHCQRKDATCMCASNLHLIWKANIRAVARLVICDFIKNWTRWRLSGWE